MVVDLYVARTRSDFEGGAAAVDGRGEVMAGVFPLLGSSGKVDVNVALTGGGFEVEVGIRSEVQTDTSGAGG